jgi:hypothetical protein
MAEQTDFARLSDAFTIAAQEISRLPNTPAIDNGRQLLEAINALREQNQQFERRIETRIENLRTEVNTNIENLSNEMNTRFRNLDLQLNAK